jgi:peptidoglycan/xylan/chitin deacetylase (PgdA/CDA1 family)
VVQRRIQDCSAAVRRAITYRPRYWRPPGARLSNRALQCKYGVTWSAVNKASAWPQPRTTTASVRPSKLDPFTLLIDEMVLIEVFSAM